MKVNCVELVICLVFCISFVLFSTIWTFLMMKFKCIAYKLL